MSKINLSNDLKNKLYNAFIKHFLGIAPKQTNKTTLEENLIWAYFIDNLDEEKVNSEDLNLIILTDCYLDFNPSDQRVYSIFEMGKVETIDYCIENLLKNNSIKIQRQTQKDNAILEDDLISDNIPLNFLFCLYTYLFKNKNLLELIPQATNRNDLKALLFIDYLTDRIKEPHMLNTTSNIGQRLLEISKLHYESIKHGEKQLIKIDDIQYKPEDEVLLPDLLKEKFEKTKDLIEDLSEDVSGNYKNYKLELENIASGLYKHLKGNIVFYGLLSLITIAVLGYVRNPRTIYKSPNPEIYYIIVEREDVLSSLTEMYTGDSYLWPAISEFNKKFNRSFDPDKICPEQRIYFPKNLLKERYKNK